MRTHPVRENWSFIAKSSLLSLNPLSCVARADLPRAAAPERVQRRSRAVTIAGGLVRQMARL